MNIGIVGCGNISDTYFESQKIFKNLNITSCADIVRGIADQKANQYNIKSQSVEEILEDKEIDLILNLTIPTAHKEIIVRSLENGKHCFSEKPLAINLKDGFEIKQISEKNNLLVGCAPDTFLGSAGQKATYNYIAGTTGNAGLMAFTKALSNGSTAYGVRVLGINPGLTTSDRMITMMKGQAKEKLGDENKWEELFKDLPFKRAAKAEEVADLTTFLVSPRCSYISGTIITIDAGVSNH